MKSNRFSIGARIKSFGFALKGLAEFFRTQHNAWIHAFAAAGVIIAGVLWDLERWEWAFLIISIGLVFISEAFNTAIEYLTDLVSPGFNEKAGKVKDLAAGAVLISAITAAAAGILVFGPRIISLFRL